MVATESERAWFALEHDRSTVDRASRFELSEHFAKASPDGVSR